MTGLHYQRMVRVWFPRGAHPIVADPESGRIRIPLGDGELSTVQLRLAGINRHRVLQLGQGGGDGSPLIDCATQGMDERSLPEGIAVSVLGQQSRRLGANRLGQARRSGGRP